MSLYRIILTRRLISKLHTEEKTGTIDKKTSLPAIGESREYGHIELQRHSYLEILSDTAQDGVLENSQYCEINDLEIAEKQKRAESERGRDNTAGRRTDERAEIASHTCTDHGKLESKLTTDVIDRTTGRINSTAVYAQVNNYPIADPRLVYDEVNQSTKTPTLVYTEVDFST